MVFDVDKVYRHIGEFGRRQRLYIYGIFIAQFAVAVQMVTLSFL